jgi:hypothetical protein
MFARRVTAATGFPRLANLSNATGAHGAAMCGILRMTRAVTRHSLSWHIKRRNDVRG